MYIKFMFSKKATRSSPSIWHYVVTSIIVAYLENTNFIQVIPWSEFWSETKCLNLSVRVHNFFLIRVHNFYVSTFKKKELIGPKKVP